MKKPIIIVGAGGFGREVAQLITDINEEKPTWEILGFVDDDPEKRTLSFMGTSCLGDTGELRKHPGVWAVMAIGEPRARRRVYHKILQISPEIRWATLVHPSSYVGDTAEIGEGSVVGWNCILTVSCRVGRFSLIYMKNTVPHDARVGDFVTLYVDVHLGGGSVVGNGSMLGTGSIVLPGIRIASGSIIGAGAVVTADIPPNSVAVGVPARVIKEVEDKW